MKTCVHLEYSALSQKNIYRVNVIKTRII